jgi:hypothetical protein
VLFTHFVGDDCPGGHTPKSEGHPGSARFHAILRELGELHDKKQQDYGTAADPFANVRGSKEWGIEPWIGALVRATDKLKRLQKFAREGRLANEPVLDSFRDMAVYTIIALVLYEETPKEVPNDSETE